MFPRITYNKCIYYYYRRLNPIFQWSNPTVNTDSRYTWTFPTSYVSECWSGSASLSANTVGGDDSGYDNTTGFKVISKTQAQTSNNTNRCIVYLIVIGK